MIKIGRVLDLCEIKKVSRIKGLSVYWVVAVFNCLETESQTVTDVEVEIILYRKKPLIVIDSKEYVFSGRAKTKAYYLVKDSLEGWNECDVYGDLIPEGPSNT